MRWELNIEKNTLVVKLAGEFDLAVADKLRTDLDNALDNNEIRHIVLNLTNVTYIDSSGLGVILGRYKRLAQHGGKMAFVKPQPQVKRILEISGLLNIINDYQDENEALAKIS